MKLKFNGGPMFRKYTQIIFLLLFIFSAGCTSKKKVISDEFATDAVGTSDTDEQVASEDDLALDEALEFAPEDSVASSGGQSSEELSLENELESASEGEIALDKESSPSIEQPPVEPAPEVVKETPAPVIESVTPPAPEVVAETPAPVIESVTPPAPEVVVEPPAPEIIKPEPVPAPRIAQITEVQFKSNDSGGALMISADQPLEYTTRMNSATNQMIIEVQNVRIPKRLKRPLNTKDMTSSIGHIDIYQKANSNIARFVVQLRANSQEPLIQPEGASLMLIGSLNSTGQEQQQVVAQNVEDSTFKVKNDPSANVEVNTDLFNESIMNTADMDEYLANNTKFYGKKISIETTDINVKDVLKFISEESGVNMVFDDAITGNISVKLRRVPWDQAFVLVLKSKGLGYRRQGTVLRIASNETLIKEEKEALEIKKSKLTDEPLIVKNFSINYANITELETKLKDFISTGDATVKGRGRVTSDLRTNTMIVTETAAKLKQVEALIRALDTQPQQVVIEARIIEASEAFTKSLGTNWGLNRGVAFGNARSSTSIGNPWADPSPILMSPAGGYTSPQSQSGSTAASLWLGKLGILGDLDVQLRLDETEDRIKILSSPRVSVLTNTQASINQSFQIAQGTLTKTDAAGNTFTETQYANLGVKLNVTPQISNLGTVRMLIDVTRTGLQGDATTNSRDMKTEVIVKSGDTSVIGGVFQSDVISSKNGVPGLKDIPILGTLFRGSNEKRQKTELMVFVTPKILSPVVQTFRSADSATHASGVKTQ
jgi:type IV pilus assembly protein PilQ